MEFAVRLLDLAQRGLAADVALDDTTLIHLFRLWVYSHRSVDLPDTTGLSWREAIFWCLGSVRAQAGTSPPSTVHSSPPRFAVQPKQQMGPMEGQKGHNRLGEPFLILESPVPESVTAPPVCPLVPAPRRRPREPALQERRPEPGPPKRPPHPWTVHVFSVLQVPEFVN